MAACALLLLVVTSSGALLLFVFSTDDTFFESDKMQHACLVFWASSHGIHHCITGACPEDAELPPSPVMVLFTADRRRGVAAPPRPRGDEETSAGRTSREAQLDMVMFKAAGGAELADLRP